MKEIGFIGVYDKIDLVIYLAKILRLTGKKILVVDCTTVQKAKYVIPVISPTVRYITEYEEIDVAVGFKNMEDVKKYLSLSAEQEVNEYDYVLIDADDVEGVKGFDLENADLNYFVTSTDCYSMKRGLEAFYGMKNPIKLIKILFSKTMDKEENDYLDFLASTYKVLWEEQRIYFPFENGDLSIIHENQRVAKIRLKKMSIQYKDGLSFIAEQILGESSAGYIRKAMKLLDKQ